MYCGAKVQKVSVRNHSELPVAYNDKKKNCQLDSCHI